MKKTTGVFQLVNLFGAAMSLPLAVFCFSDFPQVWLKAHLPFALLSMTDLLEIVAVPLVALSCLVLFWPCLMSYVTK